MLLAVDLAAKMSAACLMDENGTVIEEFSSWQIHEDEFIEKIVRPWVKVKNASEIYPNPPKILIIEDLPKRVLFMKITKKVLRIQGRIIDRMNQLGFGDSILFVSPVEWQKYFNIHGKGASERVQPKAEDLGYVPPMDFTQFHGKERTEARKVNTDYCAAYLIGLWAVNYYKEFNTYDAKDTERYV